MLPARSPGRRRGSFAASSRCAPQRGRPWESKPAGEVAAPPSPAVPNLSRWPLLPLVPEEEGERLRGPQPVLRLGVPPARALLEPPTLLLATGLLPFPLLPVPLLPLLPPRHPRGLLLLDLPARLLLELALPLPVGQEVLPP